MNLTTDKFFKTIFTSIILGILLIHQSYCSAQEVKGTNGSVYYCQHYTDENGLVQNCVTDLIPGRAGFLLLATHSGVQFYNGNHFYVPENQPGSAGYLNRVSNLYKSGDTILAQTVDKRISLITYGRILDRKVTPMPKLGILLGNSEIAWLSNYTVVNRSYLFQQQQLLGREGFHLGKMLNTDTFVIATQRRLTWYSVHGPYKSVSFPNQRLISAVFIPPYTVLFSPLNEAQIYNSRGELVCKQKIPEGEADKTKIILSKNPKVPAYYAVNNTIYKVLQKKGSCELQFDTLFHNFPDALTLAAIWQQDEQTYVGCSYVNGLYVFRKNHFKTLLPDSTNDQDASFYAQTLLPARSLLTGRNLLFKNGKYIGKLNLLKNAGIFSVLCDSKGNLWYGDGDFMYKAAPPYLHGQLICRIYTGVKAITEAPDGRIWVSNNSSSDIGYIEHDTLHRVILKDFGENCWIESFYGDKTLGSFVGTSCGIYLIPRNSDTGRLLPFVQGKDVRFITQDLKGNYWIATYGDGYYLYRNNKLTHMPIDQESRLSYVHAVIPDDSYKHLYFPTNHGLLAANYRDVISYADGYGPTPAYVLFDRNRGLRSNEFNGGCSPVYLRLPDGTISLSSTVGLLQFHPDSMLYAFDNVVGRFGIVNVWVNGILQPFAEKFYCPANTQTVMLQVIKGGWTQTSGIPLQYTVVSGEDKEPATWFDIPPSGILTITGLPYGKNRVLIRPLWSSNSGTKTMTIPITIAPYWYQTTWFKILAAIAIILTALLLLRLRYWSLVRRNRILEEHVRHATEDISNVNKQLNRDNILKNRLLSAISHDIATPLQYIEHALTRLVNQPNNVPVDRSDIEEVVDTVINLEHLTDDLVSWSQLQQNAERFTAYREPVVLMELVEEKWKPLRLQASHKSLDLELNFSNALVLNTDPKLLGIIIYNILSNAIKFSRSGKISVNALREDNTCNISIADQGKGFSPQRLQQVNGLLQIKAEKGTEEEEGKGIGLKIVRDLVYTLGGNIHIDSVQNQGTTVHIRLPNSF